MGKTGTTSWTQVKNVSGQIRLIPQKESEYKKPGPNQRFKTGVSLKRAVKKAQDEQRGGRRGGRGRGRGPQIDQRIRRRIKRSSTSVKGPKK